MDLVGQVGRAGYVGYVGRVGHVERVGHADRLALPCPARDGCLEVVGVRLLAGLDASGPSRGYRVTSVRNTRKSRSRLWPGCLLPRCPQSWLPASILYPLHGQCDRQRGGDDISRNAMLVYFIRMPS